MHKHTINNNKSIVTPHRITYDYAPHSHISLQKRFNFVQPDQPDTPLRRVSIPRTETTATSSHYTPSPNPPPVQPVFVHRAHKSITRRRLEYGVRKLAPGRTSVSEKWFDKMVQSRGSASLRGVSRRVWLSGGL